MTTRVSKPSYRDLVLDLGPAAYWRLDTDGSDEVEAFDGTVAGGVSFGEIGALAKDADGSALLDGTGTIDTGTTLGAQLDQAIALWIKPDSTVTDSARIIGEGNTAPKFGLIYRSVNDLQWIQAQWHVGSDDIRFGLDNVFYDVWSHVVMQVRADATSEIYLNGTPGPSASSPGWGNGTTLSISDGFLPFKGLLDEVMIFNRALTADEIAGLYDRGRGTLHLNG